MRYVMFLSCCLMISTAPTTFAQSRLDIVRLADSFGVDDDLAADNGTDQNQVAIVPKVVERFRFSENTKWQDFSTSQLDSAIARIAVSGNLTAAQLKKLRHAGEIDIARLFADMEAIPEGGRNREELLKQMKLINSFRKRIENMFRPKKRFDTETLFGRTANRLTNDAQVEPQMQFRVRQRLHQPVSNPLRNTFNGIQVEIDRTSETLERQWKAKLKQRGTK